MNKHKAKFMAAAKEMYLDKKFSKEAVKETHEWLLHKTVGGMLIDIITLESEKDKRADTETAIKMLEEKIKECAESAVNNTLDYLENFEKEEHH